VNSEQDREVSYTLYIAESGRHNCRRLNVMVDGEEVAALLDTGCEMSIINEQLYS
jgi:predicted aspartyl protease